MPAPTSSPAGPLLLALETSGTCGSVALLAGHACLAEYTCNTAQTHSQRLLPSIDWLMREIGIDWPRLDAIAVSLGPGSFTGLRIGLSTAKGLAMAAAKPLIGISSLDALACPFVDLPQPVCALIDARKKEVYAAFYQRNGKGGLERTSNYLVLSPAKLAAMIKEPTILTGSGAELYQAELTASLGDLARFAPPALFHVRAAAIGHLALPKWHQKDFLAPADAVPLYVRASDAELQLGSPKN